jgi:hypothetical protein
MIIIKIKLYKRRNMNGELNSMYGKKHSEETKIKMSLKQKGINNPMYGRVGKLNPMYGKKHSEETRKKISQKLKGCLKRDSLKIDRSGENNPMYGKIRSGKLNPMYGKKHTEETKLKISKSEKLEKNHRWLGGLSFEPYCPKFNKEFKNLVKLRDNFCCLNCGISEQKYILINRKGLSVHHIDYNKKNTCLKNCCTLCNLCNLKANKNREEWKNWYQEILSQKYNYSYQNNNMVINF